MTNTTNAGQGSRELPTLFSLLGDMETAATTLDDVKNLLQIFSEFTEAEEKFLEDGSKVSVLCFLARQGLRLSLRDAITSQLCEALAALHKLIDTGYELDKIGREK